MRVLILLSVVLLFCINRHSSLPTLHKLKENMMQHVFSEDDLPHRREKRAPESGTSFLKELSDMIKIKEFLVNVGDKALSVAQCLSCRFAIALLQNYVKSGATEDDVGRVIYRICTFFRIETPRVCAGVVKSYKRDITKTIGSVDLSPSDVCRFLFQGCGSPTDLRLHWTVPLEIIPKPPVRTPSPPVPNAPVYRVLQISDVHVDPHYSEGSNANCGEPLCCRETSGKPGRPEDAAGYWGDYRKCDIPLRTLENMLDHIRNTHELDYVIWTGDTLPHDIWNNTRSDVISLLHRVSKLLQRHLGGVRIFPTLGNHESSPAGSFPIPQIKGNDSIAWLYNEVVKAWGDWVPDSGSTLNSGAYYTSSVDAGLRIISLNTNYCFRGNWWILLNSTDPTGQLAWLVAQLQRAEDKGEKVHIIGHIPSGYPDCVGVWSSNYHKIINRYESTVTAQFFGHTHSDEFEIFYDDENSSTKARAFSISYISPSVTAYEGFNPGYRIYTVDGNYPGSSRVVLDHETYITNLTKANMNKELEWKFEYSAKEAYNMTSLLPSEWGRLTERFEDDDTLFQKFYKFYYKKAEDKHSACNALCKTKFICEMRRGQSNYTLLC